ncbi:MULTISPECIES: DUF4142 domain-containing protein [unclassified Micromonospora]|uniref:DUF4142 domain-containing protein n=1 Tax=Micromonospora TaxID=1873 RepID=UPI0022B5EDD5|nr:MULTISPECIES: DUF4142 domain-containing protein [unclassified Micromonospora]MCZ7419054.1 DUF4142 domain-containing protein [Verrucosispora sp. WMMA2121]WBB92722.1 DUF4142 domain-containing protein [Verrucosispora sp. WMMC514]
MAPLDSARRRQGNRSRRLAVLLTTIVAALVVLPGVALAAPAAQQLAAADQALLDGVRLAGLWEMPAGQMAAEKGQSRVVREVGAEIARQHEELDRITVEAANKLGAVIPNAPTAEQQGWLTEMKDARGARFDQIFVTRLRVAHGKIFPVIGAVRASTRNEVIRDLANSANTFVGDHMRMLESTGLVRYAELPPAALPAPGNDGLLAAAQANTGPQIGVSNTLIWAIFLGALGTGGFLTYRMFRRS